MLLAVRLVSPKNQHNNHQQPFPQPARSCSSGCSRSHARRSWPGAPMAHVQTHSQGCSVSPQSGHMVSSASCRCLFPCRSVRTSSRSQPIASSTANTVPRVAANRAGFRVAHSLLSSWKQDSRTPRPGLHRGVRCYRSEMRWNYAARASVPSKWTVRSGMVYSGCRGERRRPDLQCSVTRQESRRTSCCPRD